jgi:endoribonuclease Dicer
LPTDGHEESDLENGENEDDDDDDDDDDEIRTSAKPRKISERKRRMNAIADNYIQESILRSIKEDNQVKPGDEVNQSARWLVNQSESQEIISTPREYQTELFERAKEKNIIAVLDTGSFHT